MAELPVLGLLRELGPQLQEILDTFGFAVIDGAFGADVCDGFRHDVHSLLDSQLMEQSGNLLTVGENKVSVVQTKRGIYEKSLVLDGKVADAEVTEI